MKRNMYGCTPCPKCGSKYRCVFNNNPNIIECDDCLYREPTTKENYDIDDEEGMTP